MQNDSAEELHIKVTHPQRAHRSLAHHRKRFRQNVLFRFAFVFFAAVFAAAVFAAAVFAGDARAKLFGLCGQLTVAKHSQRRLQRVDALNRFADVSQQPRVAVAEEFF